MTKPMTSPWAPQPKQWKKPLSSFTVNDGVFSLWKGQRPTDSRPRRMSRTRFAITLSSGTRARISSRNCGGNIIPYA